MIRTMDKTLPEIAREALEVLDRNGWCKGATRSAGAGGYPIGSNCMGGAINIALSHTDSWEYEWIDIYRVFGEKIWEMFQWKYPHGSIVDVKSTLPRKEIEFLKQTTYIATFNDDDARTEAEVRAVLEKIAADG